MELHIDTSDSSRLRTAASTQPPKNAGNLPEEILLEILAYCRIITNDTFHGNTSKLRTLYGLSLVNKQFYRVVTPFLWENIDINIASDCEAGAYIRAVLDRPENAKFIKSALIQYNPNRRSCPHKTPHINDLHCCIANGSRAIEDFQLSPPNKVLLQRIFQTIAGRLNWRATHTILDLFTALTIALSPQLQRVQVAADDLSHVDTHTLAFWDMVINPAYCNQLQRIDVTNLRSLEAPMWTSTIPTMDPGSFPLIICTLALRYLHRIPFQFVDFMRWLRHLHLEVVEGAFWHIDDGDAAIVESILLACGSLESLTITYSGIVNKEGRFHGVTSRDRERHLRHKLLKHLAIYNWSRVLGDRTDMVNIGSLCGLSQLRTVVLPLGLMVYRHFMPKWRLPESLEKVTLYDDQPGGEINNILHALRPLIYSPQDHWQGQIVIKIIMHHDAVPRLEDLVLIYGWTINLVCSEIVKGQGDRERRFLHCEYTLDKII